MSPTCGPPNGPPAPDRSPPCSSWTCPPALEPSAAAAAPADASSPPASAGDSSGPASSASAASSAPGAKKKGRPKLTDKFDGLTEEEVAQKSLPDYLKEDLEIVVVRAEPCRRLRRGLTALFVGRSASTRA